MFKKILMTMVLVLTGLLVIGNAADVLAVQTPLAGSAIPKFVDPLPTLNVSSYLNPAIDTIIAGPSEIELHMCEFKANVMPSTFVPVTGTYTGTYVWGYIEGSTCPTVPQETYTGPVVVATRDVATQFKFVNNLGNTATTNVLAYKNSTDQTLHWADPVGNEANACAMQAMMGMLPTGICAQNYAGPIPTVVHLHGGELPPVLDGGPDAWITSDAARQGHGYYTKDFKGNVSSLPTLPDPNYPIGATVRLTSNNNKLYIVTATGWTLFPGAVYTYPNTQEAAPIWFHDHTLGATRLNVYAGLAGAYLITDPLNPPPSNLPGPADIIPLVLQDRMFDINGQLYFPAGVPFIPNPEHPFWVPEFVGDTIVVNGKVWPFLNVEPRRYRFLLVNGSNARTYELFLVNPVTKVMGPPIYVIGTDGGYLNAPVKLDPALGRKLVIMPGERYEIIIDFSGLQGQRLLMRNTGRTPYPKGAPPGGSTLGQIIQLRVSTCPIGGCPPDTSYNPASGTPLRAGNPIVRLPGTPGGPAIVTTPGPTQNVQKIRELTLNEVMGMPTVVNGIAYPGGPLEILVNNTKWSGINPDMTTRGDFTPITISGITTWYSERPNEGETEIWEIVNLTADAHPIHTHLTQIQLINRQSFNVNNYTAAYAAAFPGGGLDPMTSLPFPVGVYMPSYGPPKNYDAANNTLSGGKYGGNPDVTPYLQNGVKLPLPQERGWKDTVIMYPGEVTRIAVRFAPMQKQLNDSNLCYPFDPNVLNHGYVWHCHIIDHEDNEMMRPYAVVPKAGATRTYVQGTDY